MKLHWRSFIAGIIAASVSVTAVSAFAVIKTVEYNTNRVVFNGREITMVGNPMISIVKQGETNISNYMPLRAVLESMGYEVGWDGTTKTVNISTRFVTQKTSEQDITARLVGFWASTQGDATVKYHFGDDGHFEALAEIKGGSTDIYTGKYTVAGNNITLVFDGSNDGEDTFAVDIAADGKSFSTSAVGETITFTADTGDTGWTHK